MAAYSGEKTSAQDGNSVNFVFLRMVEAEGKGRALADAALSYGRVGLDLLQLLAESRQAICLFRQTLARAGYIGTERCCIEPVKRQANPSFLGGACLTGSRLSRTRILQSCG
jgi:hypothetical protein